MYKSDLYLAGRLAREDLCKRPFLLAQGRSFTF
nr:MAG TPA: hypothetical protein [Caudoviricetes sp.]